MIDIAFEIGDKVITQDNWNTYADPTDHLIHYGQTWSYDIVEESNLVYPYGWYTPSYPNNASATAKTDGKYRNEAALSANSLQGWTKEGAAGYSWEDYSGSTSTDFYMAIDMHGFHFNEGTAADKEAFKNFFGLTDSTPYQIGGQNGANHSNQLESPLFFNKLDTFEVTIKDRKTGKYYQVTSKVSGNYDVKDSWDHADVHFVGVKLPAIWEDYKDQTNHGQDNITSGPNNTSETDLEIIRISVHCVDGANGTPTYDLVLYSKAEKTSDNFIVTTASPNVMDWGPQRTSAAQWTTAIIQASGSTSRTDRVYSSVVNSPAQQLKEYKYHGKVDPEEVSSLTYASFQQPTLTITNAWNDNPLTEINVKKEWKIDEDADGTATDYITDIYSAKQNVTFSLKGTNESGSTKSVSIFTPASSSDADVAAMKTAWNTNGTGGASTGTIAKTDANKDQATWEKTFYVPTYDMSTYKRTVNDDGTETVTGPEMYSFDGNSLDEHDMSVNKDDDGQSKGKFAPSSVAVEQATPEPETGITYADWSVVFFIDSAADKNGPYNTTVHGKNGSITFSV